MSLFKKIHKATKKWQPKEKYRTEKKYISDLINFLNKELNTYKGGMPKKKYSIKYNEKKEFCDITINNKVGIDIKKTLKEQIPNDKITRLFDEILNYKKNHTKGAIFIIVGKTNEHTKTRLEKETKKIGNLQKINSPLKHLIKNNYKIRVLNKGY